MAIGFGIKQQSKDQLIQNWLSQEPASAITNDFLDLHVLTQREEWDNEQLKKAEKGDYLAAKKEILNPDIEEELVVRKSHILHDKKEVIYHGCFGHWNINVSYIFPERQYKHFNTRFYRPGRYDFTINALVGDRYKHHPKAIQYSITRQHGHDVYKQWRANVMNDIASLQQLVKGMQEIVPRVIASTTTSARSERLCKLAGLPVKAGMAFLIPSQYQN